MTQLRTLLGVALAAVATLSVATAPERAQALTRRLEAARTIFGRVAVTAEDGRRGTVKAQLADGATLELTPVKGGSIVKIYREQGEQIESSIQSVNEREASELRNLIEASDVCPVDLVTIDSQIVQASASCAGAR